MTLYTLFTALVVFLAGGVAVLIATNRELGGAITAEASIISPSGSRAMVVASETARSQAAGLKLFQERGCVGCHRADGTGVGPSLQGLFSKSVREQCCGTEIADDAYVREAILNPSATVAVGFPPVMPSFAGRFTEEELQAVIEYVKSLSAPPQE